MGKYRGGGGYRGVGVTNWRDEKEGRLSPLVLLSPVSLFSVSMILRGNLVPSAAEVFAS